MEFPIPQVLMLVKETIGNSIGFDTSKRNEHKRKNLKSKSNNRGTKKSDNLDF